MSAMYTRNTRSMSRRTFAKYGALSTGLLAGGSGTAAGATREDGPSERAEIEEGAIAPYQVVPGSRVTVLEEGVGWQPRGFDSYDRAHAISYDHAPSLRAILLTDGPLRANRSLAIGEIRDAVSETNRALVTVGLDLRPSADSETE
ncbi:hypothetical protein [Natronococcus occultus]|uniref:Uncharacterized protein n=1 Tax=Natronococcus occultus SP4 TaxID=694430 RepID=L0K590_9EURY|nr:hypothetical protein [Natronococcus occultus]AGB39539.1 hypothetical protein Natoc_3834 [Natronococcus occultus SP4]